MSNLAVVILAAGKGTRIKLDTPKPLTPLSNTTLLGLSLQSAIALTPKRIQIVVGHQYDSIRKYINSEFHRECQKHQIELGYTLQEQQLGTAHAVELALDTIVDCERVLVLYADSPLLTLKTLKNVTASKHPVAFLVSELDNPHGYGRIILKNSIFKKIDDNKKSIKAIVEEQHASEQQRKICLVNSGVMIADHTVLTRLLPLIKPNSQNGEYYLTQIPNIYPHSKIIYSEHPYEICGVNTLTELVNVSEIFNSIQVDILIEKGLRVANRNSLYIYCGNTLPLIGSNSFIDVNTQLKGSVTIGNNVSIGAHCIISNSTIADDCTIEPYSYLDGATLLRGSSVGPYGRLRPGSKLGVKAKVGNFVEVKNSYIKDNAKANHLSYIGDATVGKRVNIGAGTITCNYDGKNKHKTIIGDDAFVGSGVQFVAPITIGEGSRVGAGTTVRNNLNNNDLIFGQTPQRIISATKLSSRTKPQPKARPKPQPKSQPKARPKPQPKARPKSQPKARPKPQPKARPSAKGKTKVSAKGKTKVSAKGKTTI